MILLLKAVKTLKTQIVHILFHIKESIQIELLQTMQRKAGNFIQSARENVNWS